jgi:PadR family transcriptional regulator AphA
MAEDRPLTSGEWSILGLLDEAPAHGWALSVALSPDGEIGGIWSLARPLVYRALEILELRGLVEPSGSASSARGPNRKIFRLTRKGRAAFQRWLGEPVAHIRDVRPDLLLKLAFLRRSGRDTRALLEAQQTRLETLLVELEEHLDGVTLEQELVVRFRIEAARGALRFIEAEHLAADQTMHAAS